MNRYATLISSTLLMIVASLSYADPVKPSSSIADAPSANAPSVAATPSIYKHVDADGNISYSDTPPDPAAKTLEMEPLGTISMPKPAKFVPTQATAAPIKYESLSLTSPSNNSTYQNLSEPVQVSVQLLPGLQSNHTLTLLMDGRVLTSDSLTTQVENLERGSHVFTAQVQDASGKVLITSAPVTIHVHRNSILNNRQSKPDA